KAVADNSETLENYREIQLRYKKLINLQYYQTEPFKIENFFKNPEMKEIVRDTLVFIQLIPKGEM
ncbi:MAG: hypothetical protein CVT92_16885, partial [Bacteroidetes bacterium HGW-Bacteroidetes-1]